MYFTLFSQFEPHERLSTNTLSTQQEMPFIWFLLGPSSTDVSSSNNNNNKPLNSPFFLHLIFSGSLSLSLSLSFVCSLFCVFRIARSQNRTQFDCNATKSPLFSVFSPTSSFISRAHLIAFQGEQRSIFLGPTLRWQVSVCFFPMPRKMSL